MYNIYVSSGRMPWLLAGSRVTDRLSAPVPVEWSAASGCIPPSGRGGGAVGGVKPGELGCCSVEQHHSSSGQPKPQ